ncbi:MAG TPA: helicase HerA-like domain-containing protein, partial [Candidatus Limnocylindrales bacterium]
SAHEIITARLAAAQQAAQSAAMQQPVGAPGTALPTPAGGGMTAAQQEREIARQAREMAREQRDAERARRADERAARADARAHDRAVETGVRTAGRVLTSRAGQSLIRGVSGTLFGGGRSR